MTIFPTKTARRLRTGRHLQTALAGLMLLSAGMSAQAGINISAPFSHVGGRDGVSTPFTNVRAGYHRGGHHNSRHDQRHRDHRRRDDRRSHGYRNSRDRDPRYRARYDRWNHRQERRHDHREPHDRRYQHGYAGRRDHRGFFGRW